MYTIFSKKNKKSLEMSFKAVIMVVIAVFLGIMLFQLGDKLYAAFFGESDDGSRANFDRLYSKILELLKSQYDEDYRKIKYFIVEDKILAMFSTNWDETNADMNTISRPVHMFGKNLYKPFNKCGNSACICLYKDELPYEPEKRHENLLDCRSDGLAGKNIIFINIFRTQQIQDYDDSPIQEILIVKKFEPDTKTYGILIYKIDTTSDVDPGNIEKKRIDASR